MSASVRARRPATPPLGLSNVTFSAHKYPPSLSRKDSLDADARRQAAAKGYGPGHKSHSPGGLSITSAEWKLLVVVLIVATLVRMFRISQPTSVVFDEVHFGKFAGRYIKTRYFVDVHPPLAKLLITAAAFLFGFDGDFDFKDIGKEFLNTPYVAMRMVPAVLGIATIPLAYLTLRALECKASTALLASLFLTFENGLITQSRHILLDSPLVFFTALTIFSFVGFCNEDRNRPFSEHWWTWLVLTGLSLGAVVSCKWVGLFTIATVGVCTILRLWLLLGDTRVSVRTWSRHFFARALCLIVIPILFYMTMFEIHFLILGSSGDGDAFMSSEFRQTLGHGMPDTYADVGLGSEVTIRHLNTQGGYLHSHSHNYPGGSGQQQVTLYPHRDENNNWLILNATVDNYPQYDYEHQPMEYVKHGSRIRLRHIVTDKALHSHDVRPPVSDVDFQNEISAYGMSGFTGDLNDDWVVEIVNGGNGDRESRKRVKTLRTHFKLRHLMTGCYLFSHTVKLPEWAYEQQEVTCNKQAVQANSIWYVETASKHPQLPAHAEKVNYKIPGFLAKFLELQKVMWTTNSKLTDRHVYDSRPWSWPILRRGINFWVKEHRQVYLIGNPFVWWLSTASVTAYIIVRGILILRAKRGYKDFENTKLIRYDTLCGFLFTGYALHYLPFFLMSRQLFLHHYFPALYFAILLSSVVFDLATSTLRPRLRLQVACVMIIIAILSFDKFSPLVYGNAWTRTKCNSARWLRTWDFACEEFPDDVTSIQLATPNKSVPGATIGGEPGGRAPVVVDDLPEIVLVANAETSTTIPLGGPEPGQDIFAQQEVKEAKSVPVSELPSPEENERVVSIVSAGEKVHIVSEVLGEEAFSVPAEQQTSASMEPAKESTAPGEQEGRQRPEGPLDQAEALANEVAQELYPGEDGA